MATITKRGDAFLIRVNNGFDGNGREIKKSMTYHPEAKSAKAIEKEVARAAALFEDQVKSGSYTDGEKTKFRDYVEIWSNEWAATHLTARTWSDYLALIKTHAMPRFGNLAISKIRAQQIQSMIVDLNKDHAPATVRKIVAAIDSVFIYAYKTETIRENPIGRCELPRSERDGKLHCFDVEQSRRFLGALSQPFEVEYKRGSSSWSQAQTMPLQLQAFFHLAIYSGARRGELLALRWCDIDFAENKIMISRATEKLRTGEQRIKTPKTKAGVRDVRLPAKCFSLLQSWRREQLALCFALGADWRGETGKRFDENFIFIQTENGIQMHSDTPYQAMQRFIKRYNENVSEELRLPVLRLHDLRHSTASLLLSEGMDIEEVARRLGHARPSTTLDFYGHALPEKDDQSAALLERLLG